MKKVCVDRIEVIIEKAGDDFIIKKHPILEKETKLDSVEIEETVIDCLMQDWKFIVH